MYLVDLWGHQENYVDGANVEQAEQARCGLRLLPAPHHSTCAGLRQSHLALLEHTSAGLA